MVKCAGTHHECEECGKRMLVDLALCEDCREDYDASDCLKDRLDKLDKLEELLGEE